MTTLRPMFPNTIDSTMLSTFRSCPQKFFRQYAQHWKSKSKSVHLVAGGAFAKGVEVARQAYFEGSYEDPINELQEDGTRKLIWRTESGPQRDHATAQEAGLRALIAAYGDFECPSDSAKSLERTAGALEFYYSRYPFDADGTEPLRFPSGKSGIEFSFSEPLEVAHPVTGAPILYTGRSDLLASYLGSKYVFDEKTTSALGASWERQWDMRSQFTGYIWAAQRQDMDIGGAVVRGVSILKTKYDTLQVITYRTPYEVQRWLDQVHRDIERMIECWRKGWWDFNLDAACNEYGGCGFTRVCKSDSPDIWLPMYFEQRVWDPIGRREWTPEEWEQHWGHDATALLQTS